MMRIEQKLARGLKARQYMRLNWEPNFLISYLILGKMISDIKRQMDILV